MECRIWRSDTLLNCFCRVRSIGKFESVSIDGGVVGEPQNRRDRDTEKKLQSNLAEGALLPMP